MFSILQHSTEQPFHFAVQAAEERKRALERQQLEALAGRERKAEEVRAKRLTALGPHSGDGGEERGAE